MKWKIVSILLMLCLTMITGITSAAPTYAADMDLKFDYHDLHTKDSWFQPVIIRNVPGRNYAWTCYGSVYFDEDSRKTQQSYWDSGALLWYMPTHLCGIYKSPYIRGAKLQLGWIYIDPSGTQIGFKGKHSDIHEITREFGDTSGKNNVEVKI